METFGPAIRNTPRLPARADMLKHRFHISFQVIENPRHMVQAPLDRIQPGQQHFATDGNSLFCWHRAAIEHRIKVLRVPAKRHRQRFQRASATATLNGVPLDFPDNRRRHMRALRKFALTPSKLSYALVDGFGNRRPILRHSILRRSHLGAEISGPSAFCGRSRPSFRRGSPNSSQEALKSAVNRRFQRTTALAQPPVAVPGATQQRGKTP
jgi:hypothetical protein